MLYRDREPRIRRKTAELVEPSVYHGERIYRVLASEGNDKELYRRCRKWELRKAIRELLAMFDDCSDIWIEREPLPALGVLAGVVIPVRQREFSFT